MTTTTNNNSPKDIAQSYYKAMGDKNLQGLGQHLHSDVQFIGPMAEFSGKEQLLEGAKGFFPAFNSISIRHVFENQNQATLIYDLICPNNTLRVAALFTIDNQLITKLELFFDTHAFRQ